jgi:UrcA family protein
MFRSIKPAILVTLAITAGISATAQVTAAGIPSAGLAEVGRVTVSYGDLDLGSDVDARAMLGRLQDAAYKACGGDPRSNPNYKLLWPRIKADYRKCRNEAVTRAVLEVDAPVLSKVFLGGEDARPVREAANRN